MCPFGRRPINWFYPQAIPLHTDCTYIQLKPVSIILRWVLVDNISQSWGTVWAWVDLQMLNPESCQWSTLGHWLGLSVATITFLHILGVLNLSRLKELLIPQKIQISAEPKSSGDIDQLMRRFQHLEASFAVTYLVNMLAKFELVAPLDSQHLLVPALLPLRRLADLDSKDSDAPNRQVRGLAHKISVS